MKKAKGSPKKAQKKKLILGTLAVGATGILGYFGWQYFKKQKRNKGLDLETLIKENEAALPSADVLQKPKAKPAGAKASVTNDTSSDFPLKRGSKGANVKKLQEALLSKYGKSALPKYGADGDFGSETVSALQRLGLPSTITESTFNVIAQGAGTGSKDFTAIAKELYTASVSKDFSKTITLLKKLTTTEEYSKANESFKEYRINGVRQTIVNGLLFSFPIESQKQNIKLEFLRMGLQFDGAKWSLSGFDGRPIITIKPTTVWLNGKESVKVPSQMVLGNEVSKRLDYTLFENGNKYFLVQSGMVQYL